jgi:hypothetical protein
MHVNQLDIKRNRQRSWLWHQLTVARDAEPATNVQHLSHTFRPDRSRNNYPFDSVVCVD